MAEAGPEEALKRQLEQFTSYSENREDLATVGELWITNQRLARKVQFLEHQIKRLEETIRKLQGNHHDHQHES
jgi:hypothetical protein